MGISSLRSTADQPDETISADSDLLDELPDAEPKLGLKYSEPEAELRKVMKVLDTLDAVTEDSKFQALARLLKEMMPAETTRLGVFAAYAATVSYLQASLEEILGVRVYGLTGSMPYDERRASLGQFGQQGGVLVALD